MKIIACYDNGGKTFDRYTVVFDEDYNREGTMKECLGLSDNPADPQGFSQWCGCQMGRHLGKKLSFEQLPEHIQKHVMGRIA